MPKPKPTPSPYLSLLVRRLRDYRNWTSEELARRSGLRGNTIRCLLANRSGISVHTLEQLAAAFNMKPSRLLSKAERMNRP